MKPSLYSSLLLWTLVVVSSPATAAAGSGLTALDEYVRQADASYRYQVVNTVRGEGYTTYIVEMTSQRWLTEAEVNLPLWEHIMTITRPDDVVSDIGFLFIGGGDKLDAVPPQAAPTDIRRAIQSGTVVSTLYLVPNQPLAFTDDAARQRSEDEIIAYTWDKYLRTGDEKWPLRLPMTKSAVRAMDTVTSLMRDQAGLEVDRFVVAGGSKRGWTTWTTAAVDGRVIAIAPIVIDLLNVEDSFRHHFNVYGRYADAVGDYVNEGIMDWMGTAEFAALMELVEPFEYRDRLMLPKFLLNATGDQFFLPDSWQFYWDELIGEKHLRYVPNSDHGMGETDVVDSLDAWYHAVVHNVSVPRYNWDVADDGTITVMTLDRPEEVLLWQAHNPAERNFMKDVIGPAYTSTALQEVEPGVYRVKLDPPTSGYTAYFVELSFPSGLAVPFKFSTGIKVVPDVTTYNWRPSPESARR